MARRRIHEQGIRSIMKSKGSYFVSLPMSLMRSFRWQERQRVVVKKFGKNRLVISDWKPKAKPKVKSKKKLQG